MSALPSYTVAKIKCADMCESALIAESATEDYTIVLITIIIFS
jgi:hypothetical protein